MAVDDYTTRAQVKVVCQIPSADTTRDALIDYIIPLTSREVDTFCHRHFWPKTASEIYDFQTTNKLWLRGDLHSLTSITNGTGDLIDLTKIFTYPELGPPYGWLEFNQSSSQAFLWAPTTSQQCITVTGVWGYLVDGATPKPVQDGTAAWISYLVTLRANTGIRSKTIGDYTVTFANVLEFLRNGPPNEAAAYLNYFVKRRFGTIRRDM